MVIRYENNLYLFDGFCCRFKLMMFYYFGCIIKLIGIFFFL